MTQATRLFLATGALLCGLFSLAGYAQGTQTEFGKNRVQFHKDFEEWSQYESPNFITYWYGEGRYAGQATVQLAELDHEYIKRMLEYTLNDKIQIIVYTDLTDLKQSNIGAEEAFENEGGQTKIVGNKMFVYFDGNHRNLRRQIREGIASVYMNAMLFGSNLQEIVQNAVLLNLPPWYKDGVVSFIGETWSTTLDSELRDAFLSGEYQNFEELAEAKPKLAGHSLWYFLSQNYGIATVANLLYFTRIHRSVETGFTYILGSTYDASILSWQAYFEERYQNEQKYMDLPTGEPVPIKNKRALPTTQAKLSPNGRQLAYVQNEIGRYKVFVQDLDSGERNMILKGGFRNAIQATDYDYPLIAWSPSGYELVAIFERRDVLKLLRYDLNTKETTVEDISTEYQRIHSIDFVDNDKLVLSGTVRGNSDLYLYFLATRQSTRLTNDFWDDLDAVYTEVRGRPGILFASNRQDTLLEKNRLDSILPVQPFDIFYFDLEERSTELIRITDTPLASERDPFAIDTTWVGYRSDASGTYNRYTAYLEEYLHHTDKVVVMNDGTEITFHPDSALVSKLDSAAIAMIDTVALVDVYKWRGVGHPQTDYRYNIQQQHSARRNGTRLVEVLTVNDLPTLYLHDIDPAAEAIPFRTRFRQLLSTTGSAVSQGPPPARFPTDNTILVPIISAGPVVTDTIPTVIRTPEPDTNKVDVSNYLFQSEFDDEAPAPAVRMDTDDERPEAVAVVPAPPTARDNIAPGLSKPAGPHKFRPGRIIPYRIKFRTDFVNTTFDNDRMFDIRDSYTGTPDDFAYPSPGILFKANLKDLFEDYEVEGGVRLPLSFNGAEYFLTFNNRKRRLDQKYFLYRRNLTFTDTETRSILPQRTQNNLFLAKYELRYPLDIFTSIRASAGLRFDRTTSLATDANNLTDPSDLGQRLQVRLEYVFDNTLDVALNIKNGTRYKLYGEAMKGFQIDFTDEFQFDINDGFLFVAGMDFRHYQRFLKHSVLATRLAGSASFGDEKIAYFLGGTNGWITPRFNNDIPRPLPSDGFAFQSVEPNVRGFQFNIRNGSAFALSNTEVRVPIFKYFSKRLKSNFLRNFQAVAFFDAGTAWQGASPFDDESPLNTLIVPDPEDPNIDNPLVVVKVNYFREPIVMSYGFGARALIFGYFVRVDYGYGIETRQVQEPRLHISLGKDF